MRPKKKPTKKTPPNLKVEQSLWADGHEIIVGIDEVGRGSWAGPLSIGAVVLPKTGRVNGVRDSKMLTEREREALFDRVADGAQHWAIGSVSHDECDRIGMSADAARAEVCKNSMWPGTALVYWLGTDGLHELRKTRERVEGSDFSLRRFHDRVLSFGSTPVPLLERIW